MLRNASDLTIAEIATRVLLVVTTITVSRAVGPSALGKVSVAMALFGYGGIIADAGLTVPAIRSIARDPDTRDPVATATVAIQVLTSIVAAVALIFVVRLLGLPPSVQRLVRLGVPLLVVQGLSINFVLQAAERMRPVAVLRVVSQLITTAIAISLIIRTHDVAWLPVGTWLGLLAAVVAGAAIVWRSGWRPQVPTLQRLSDTAVGGLPFIAQAVIIQGASSLDVVMLGVLRNAHEVGEYAAANRIAFTSLGLVGVLSMTIFPALSRLHASDPSRFDHLIEVTTKLVARVALVGTVLVVVEAAHIVRIAYGPAFAASAGLLQILFLTVPLGWLNTIYSESLIAAGRQRAVVAVVGGSAAAFVVLLRLGIPIFGPPGAAWACVIENAAVIVGLNVAAAGSFKPPALTFATQWPYAAIPLAVMLPVRLLYPAMSLWIGPPAALLLLVVWDSRATSTIQLLRGVSETRKSAPDERQRS